MTTQSVKANHVPVVRDTFVPPATITGPLEPQVLLGGGPKGKKVKLGGNQTDRKKEYRNTGSKKSERNAAQFRAEQKQYQKQRQQNSNKYAAKLNKTVQWKGSKIILGDKEDHHVKEQHEYNQHRAQEMAKSGFTKGDITRPYYKGGKLQQANYPKVVTAWDEMLVAKTYPGQFNTPYVAGMNVTNLPTTTFNVSNSISQANIYDQTGLADLGSAEYTMIMWSTSMTAFFGDGGAGDIAATQKLGGLVVKQITADKLDEAWISRDIFQKTLGAYTMIEVLGSDMTGFSAGGFVWAGDAQMNILCPRANLVGGYFQGCIQFGQLPDQNAVLKMSLRQLINIAGDIECLEPQFNLRTAVVNNNIVYASQDNNGGQLGRNDFVGELVNYVILMNVAQNITTGATSEFVLQLNVKGNGVFWAKPEDSIANNLYKNVKEKKSGMPGMLEGVGQDPLATPKKVNSLWEGVQHVAKAAYQTVGGWQGLAGAASALLLEPSPDTDATWYIIRANYMDALISFDAALTKLSAQNKYLDVSASKKMLESQLQLLRDHPGRLIPMEDTADDPDDPDQKQTQKSIQPTKMTRKNEPQALYKEDNDLYSQSSSRVSTRR